MIVFVNENKELKNRTFPLATNIRKHLQNVLKNYNGDKTVDGYKRLNNILQMDTISYNEMKRIKNFFDNFNGREDSVEYILNGGDFMKTWVNNTLNTATKAVHDFKQAKKDAGIKNAFIKPHEKERQIRKDKPTQLKIQTKNVSKNIADNNSIKFENKYRKTVFITENQMNEIKECMDDYIIFSEINNMIQESLSINDIVLKERNKISDLIEDRCNHIKDYFYDERLNLKFKNFILKEQCFGINITFNCVLYYCSDYQYETIIEDKPNINNCYSHFINNKKAFIFFNFLLTEKKNIKYYLYNIQHELNHIFQQINIGSRYDTNEVSKHQYGFINNNINSSNDIIHNIASIMYLSLPYEQDSFVNGLYAEMENNPELAMDSNVYKKSETWNKLMEMKRNIDFFIKNEKIIKDKIKELNGIDGYLNLDYNNILKSAEIAFKRFQTKIGHVLVRVFDNNQMYEARGIKTNFIYQINEGQTFRSLNKNKEIEY